jgi:hypothetical protein
LEDHPEIAEDHTSPDLEAPHGVEEEEETGLLEREEPEASNVYITAVNLPEEDENEGNLSLVLKCFRQQNFQSLLTGGDREFQMYF